MKKILSLILSLCIIVSLSVNVLGLSIMIENENGTFKINDFLDTKGHWAHDTILKFAEYELVVGSNGNFMPDQPIKRGDLAIIIDRMLGLKTASYNYFNDLHNNDYYANSLLKCVAAEYITGVGTNEIDPEGYATREQVAVILARIFDLTSNNYSSSTSFKDDNKISSWARSSVSGMSKLGYINGTDKGYVNPQSNITRAELVTLLSNIANTYIPKKSGGQMGTNNFKNDFPINVVSSFNLGLIQSTVGRDLILTPDCSSVNLENTVVKGRILAIGKKSITLSDSKVSQIVLLNEKSTLVGVTENIGCVRVNSYASESTLDGIPSMVILEAGTRVRIAGTMYENESTREKTYYASDLQGAISDEQGYIIGGPKISGVKFEQDMDNTITVSNIRITEGNNEIREIGVIWLEQDDDENAKNPTYKKNDGKKIYRSDKIDELINFEVGEVEGTCAYRVYVKDKDGLFAYSNSTIFSEYEFTTSLNIYDNNYPETIDVEIVFRGDSVPDISNVRVVYDIDELYSENHKDISLKLYSDPDAEYQPDSKKYKRYIGTIKSNTIKVNGENIIIPPTSFGYIITFKNGTLINRFPVLTNVVPEGVSPMASLETGVAMFDGSTSLSIRNNKISTRYVIPQEVGIVYKTSSSESISRPTAGASGWERKVSYVNLDVNESTNFNISIPLNSTEGYTYYCAYVKTSNGYWYGEVRKFSNDVQGDEGGPIIYNESINILDSTTIHIPFQVKSGYSLNTDISNNIVEIRKNGQIDMDWVVGAYEKYEYIYDSEYKSGFFCIQGLNSDACYEIDIRLQDNAGLKSNLVTLSFDMRNYNKITLQNKTNLSNNKILYNVILPNQKYKLSNCVFNLGVDGVISVDSSNNTITISEVSDLSNAEVIVSYTVILNENIRYPKICNCQQIIKLN